MSPANGWKPDTTCDDTYDDAMTRAERAALAAAVARLLALVDTGELKATEAQTTWLRGYLAGLAA